MPALPERWIILRVRFVGPFVVVRLQSDTGERARLHWQGGLEAPPAAADALAEVLDALTRDLPDRPGPHARGPIPLALFLDVPAFLWSEPQQLDAFLAPLIRDRGDRIQVVGLAGDTRRARARFTLPFRVVAHGALALGTLVHMSRDGWTTQPAVRERGMVLDLEPHLTDAAIEQVLRATPQDVVVTSEVYDTVEVVRRLPLAMRPRLILAPDPGSTRPPLPRVPAGVALALTGGGSQAVQEVLFGLVHDLPLHEAIKAATRWMPELVGQARLFATPTTNQALRLRDALMALQDEIETLALAMPADTVADFMARATRRVDEVEASFDDYPDERRVREWQPPPAEIDARQLAALREQSQELLILPEHFEGFQRESQGLIPMAEAATVLSALRDKLAAQQVSLAAATADPIVRAYLARHENRVVDIGVQRLDTTPMLVPVDGRTALEAGALYRVRVHIGNPASDSVVVGPRPPIDPLLPATEAGGHDLDIAIQGKTFTVDGPRMQTVHLPRFGGSAPVYFPVRAPRALGEASLRVHVYYRNHLVHSYLLEAVIAEREHREPGEVLRATLAYARVERLSDVDTVKPRLLSIGINDSGGTTHDIIFKGTSGATEISLLGQTYKDQVAAFFTALEQASRDPVNRNVGRRYPRVSPGATAPPDAAAVLRDLIKKGADLYESMRNTAIDANPAMAVEFAAIKRGRDKPIQVTRFTTRDVFPWPLVYDFNLPPDVPNAPVCLGLQTDLNGVPQPCGHTFKSKVYCVDGFWSVRHRLEELIKRPGERHDKVERPTQDGIRLVCDTRLPGVPTLVKDLGTSIGAPHVVSGPTAEAPLLDLLWQDPPERPAILVVLGHMDEKLQPGILDSVGIVLQPNEWLTRRHFSERIESVWDERRPIVMLMACDAAALTVTTLNDFVTNFHTAGAAAIVGAQAVVASDLAASSARELTDALWSGDSLGFAMTTFRRRMLATGNPLAFLFHAIGDVDLTMQEAQP